MSYVVSGFSRTSPPVRLKADPTYDNKRLARDELDCRLAPPRRAKPSHVLQRGGRWVLHGVRPRDRVANALALDTHGANTNLALANLNRPKRILQKRAMPADRF